MAVIKAGLSDPNTTFNFNGLDYKKGIWEVFYNNKEIDQNGNINKDKITVGIRNQTEPSYRLQRPIKISDYENGTGTPYSDLDTLVLDLTALLGFDNGGGLGSGINITQKVNQFSDLVAGNLDGDLAYVENSQGTQWLPGTIGGTYFPAGWYIWNGTDWVSDRNAIANQLEQNILSITDTEADVLQLQTDLGQEVTDRQAGDEGSVTIHNDISDAGSGLIITDAERLLLNSALQNETVTNLQIIGNTLRYTNESGVDQDIDLSLYLDDTNLARIVTGTVSPLGILTVTRDDSSTFDIDLSLLLDTDSVSSIINTLGTGNLIATHDDGQGNVVNILETITSLTLNANVLTYTREDGSTDTIDLSLYLDDTNLARLVSGVLDSGTGIATFTRDDATTFTVDLSSLLDNQTAAEVPYDNTNSGLVAINVQIAIDEVEARVEANENDKADKVIQITGQNPISGGGDLSANRTLELVNDEANPANVSVYGTDNVGAKGFNLLTDLISNNSGQIKLNWAIIDEPQTAAGFTAGVPEPLPLNNNYTVSGSPTTTYPFLANQAIGGQNVIDPTTLFLRELKEGQTIIFRVKVGYFNKGGGQNGNFTIRMFNPNPASTFEIIKSVPTPDQTTTYEEEFEFIAIADSLSLDPNFGYAFEAQTTFNDGNLVGFISSITAFYLATDLFNK